MLTYDVKYAALYMVASLFVPTYDAKYAALYIVASLLCPPMMVLSTQHCTWLLAFLVKASQKVSDFGLSLGLFSDFSGQFLVVKNFASLTIAFSLSRLKLPVEIFISVFPIGNLQSVLIEP